MATLADGVDELGGGAEPGERVDPADCCAERRLSGGARVARLTTRKMRNPNMTRSIVQALFALFTSLTVAQLAPVGLEPTPVEAAVPGVA